MLQTVTVKVARIAAAFNIRSPREASITYRFLRLLTIPVGHPEVIHFIRQATPLGGLASWLFHTAGWRRICRYGPHCAHGSGGRNIRLGEIVTRVQTSRAAYIS